MAAIIRTPEVSANSTHAVLQHWLKSEGDKVAKGEPIAGIETDKATVEMNAEADGVIGRLIVNYGGEAEVHFPIGIIVAEGETLDIDAVLGSSDDKVVPVESDRAREPDLPASPAQRGIDKSTVTTKSEPAANGAQADYNRRVFASPLARCLAEDHGMALEGMKGSGPHGRVIKVDVVRAMEQGASAPAAEPSTSPKPRALASVASVPGDGQYTETAHSRMWRAIARRLTESKSAVPHFLPDRYLPGRCPVGNARAVERLREPESFSQRLLR